MNDHDFNVFWETINEILQSRKQPAMEHDEAQGWFERNRDKVRNSPDYRFQNEEKPS